MIPRSFDCFRLVSRIKRSEMWQGRCKEFRKFFAAETECVEQFDQLEDEAAAAKELFTVTPEFKYSLKARLAEHSWLNFRDNFTSLFPYLFSTLRPGAMARILSDLGATIGFFYNSYVDKMSTEEAHSDFVLDALKSVSQTNTFVSKLKLDEYSEKARSPSQSDRPKVRNTFHLLQAESMVHELKEIVASRGPKSWRDVGKLADIMQTRPACLHEDRQVQSDASTTLSEVLLSFGSVEGMTEDFLQPELAATAVKCANAMAATPDEHHWSSDLASLQTLSEWLDKSDEALTPTEKHLRLGELKVAWQQYCTIAEKASEQMTESDTLQSLEVFRRKAFDIFSARFEATVQGLAGAAVNGALGPLKATLHEAAQIAGGQSSHRHWGDGCSDFTLQGICKHAEVILPKEILVQIDNSEVKPTQDLVLLYYVVCFAIIHFHFHLDSHSCIALVSDRTRNRGTCVIGVSFRASFRA